MGHYQEIEMREMLLDSHPHSVTVSVYVRRRLADLLGINNQ